jgi:hypothetical protein
MCKVMELSNAHPHITLGRQSDGGHQHVRLGFRVVGFKGIGFLGL